MIFPHTLYLYSQADTHTELLDLLVLLLLLVLIIVILIAY